MFFTYQVHIASVSVRVQTAPGSFRLSRELLLERFEGAIGL